jgi:hypothetical protein
LGRLLLSWKCTKSSLGLIREAGWIAANELEKLGVHLDQARIETLRVLREYQEQGSTESEPPVPAQATALQAEGEVGQHCLRCQAHCPDYFRYCFNCGSQLPSEREKEETPESA